MGKYKVGDIVRIKTREEMDNSPDVTKSGNEWYVVESDSSLWFVESMYSLLGNEVLLHSSETGFSPYKIFENCEEWNIDDWMIAEKIGSDDVEVFTTTSDGVEVDIPNSDEPIILNRVVENTNKQTVNIEGIMKDDFMKMFEWLVSVGFNLDVTIVGETYKIKGEKLTE